MYTVFDLHTTLYCLPLADLDPLKARYGWNFFDRSGLLLWKQSSFAFPHKTMTMVLARYHEIPVSFILLPTPSCSRKCIRTISK
jgi:hypothetical protein